MNDLLFSSENKIIDLVYITNNYPGQIGKEYPLDSKRIDFWVKYTFSKEEDKILTKSIRKE